MKSGQDFLSNRGSKLKKNITKGIYSFAILGKMRNIDGDFEFVL